jgi:hypothetical protein
MNLLRKKQRSTFINKSAGADFKDHYLFAESADGCITAYAMASAFAKPSAF